MTQPRQTLRPTSHVLADALDVNEVYRQKGWTAGLAIVPSRTLEGVGSRPWVG